MIRPVRISEWKWIKYLYNLTIIIVVNDSAASIVIRPILQRMGRSALTLAMTSSQDALGWLVLRRLRHVGDGIRILRIRISAIRFPLLGGINSIFDVLPGKCFLKMIQRENRLEQSKKQIKLIKRTSYMKLTAGIILSRL